MFTLVSGTVGQYVLSTKKITLWYFTFANSVEEYETNKKKLNECSMQPVTSDETCQAHKYFYLTIFNSFIG